MKYDPYHLTGRNLVLKRDDLYPKAPWSGHRGATTETQFHAALCFYIVQKRLLQCEWYYSSVSDPEESVYGKYGGGEEKRKRISTSVSHNQFSVSLLKLFFVYSDFPFFIHTLLTRGPPQSSRSPRS